jgi:endonuclease/exonuclease/phosphatase family metal-dependent hydrolase
LALLVRSWNVFHGNADPPERRGFLEEAVRLASADRPDVLCLQEVPAWALPRLAGWSGMRSFGAVAARPLLGSAELGRTITAVNQGLFRSAVTGQAVAILLGERLRPLGEDTIVLNPRGFRRAWARALDLDMSVRLAWAKERRVCQAVRAEVEGRFLTVANLHASSVRDRRCQDAEILRAAAFADAFAEPSDLLVLAGDLNVVSPGSRALDELAGTDWGFSKPIPGLDQILVRGAEANPRPWPVDRHHVGQRRLSDHSPVETSLE